MIDRWETLRGASMTKEDEGAFFTVADVKMALAEHAKTNVAPRKRDRDLYRALGFTKRQPS